MRDELSEQAASRVTEETKPQLGKFHHEADLNVRDKFNEALLSYARRDTSAARTLSSINDKGAALSIAAGLISRPESNSLALSPMTTAQGIILLFMQLEWHTMMNELLKKTYDPRKGYPYALGAAFLGALSQGYRKQADKAARGLFSCGARAEGCALLAAVEDREFSAGFKGELLASAKNGEGREKTDALAALSVMAADDSEVRTHFISVLDDWDEGARGFAGGVLAKAKGRDVALAALARVLDEQNPAVSFQLIRIIENNQEELVPVLRERLSAAKTGRDAEAILLPLRKMEKGKKLKALVAEMKPRVPSGVAEALARFLG